VVEGAAQGGDQFTGTATACTAEGLVLQRFAAVDYVATADLAGRFLRSAQGLAELAGNHRGRDGRP
jgi:hypothetical protein